METLLFVDNALFCLEMDHGAAHLGCRPFVQRDGNNTETVPFPMFFAFVLYGHKAEECNITWPIAHEVNRCIFWTSCTGVSRKRHFLSIMRNFGWTSFAHRYGIYTENVLLGMFFVFFFAGI